MINDLLSIKHSAVEEPIPKTKSDYDTAKAIRALSNPTVPTQTGTDPPPSPIYKPNDQKELDRIINNNQR